LKIIFAGTPKNAALTLEALIAAGQNVVAVLTREDAPVGRKRIMTSSPVATVAQTHDLPVIKANRITPVVNEQLESFNADLGIAVAYGAIFKTETLELPRLGWLNIHYSLLPAWRGAAPVQHSILCGNPETGVSIFKLDEGMDTGPLLSVIPTQIEPGENAGDLLGRLTHIGISGILEILPAVEAGIAKQAIQSLDGVTFAPKLTRSDAQINWHSRARSIELQVRAMNPEPMAWAQHEDTAIRIVEATAIGAIQPAAIEFEQNAQIGQVQIDGDRVFVLCGDQTALELKIVQPAGKNQMDASAWARGLKKAAVLH
jgi:methionyl-tRNA formyltransferase